MVVDPENFVNVNCYNSNNKQDLLSTIGKDYEKLKFLDGLGLST